MDPNEYVRLRRLIVISWTVSLILGMIILYFGSKELSNVKNAVSVQGSTLNSNSLKVDKLIEEMNKINSSEFQTQLKGSKGDKGNAGTNGKNGSDGKNAISNNTIIEKQSVKQVPVKGDKGDKGDKGKDARQIELCKLTGHLLQSIPINIGWRYVGSTVCMKIEGKE